MVTTCVVGAKVQTAARWSHGNACVAVAQLCHRSVTAMTCVPLGATWPIANTWRCCRRARPTTAAGESSRQEGLREALGSRVGRSPRVASGAVEHWGAAIGPGRRPLLGQKGVARRDAGPNRSCSWGRTSFAPLTRCWLWGHRGSGHPALGGRIDSREASNQGRSASHYFARTGESAAQKAWTNSL
jgi:hypothetical protein